MASECTTGQLTRTDSSGCAITTTYSGAASSAAGTVVYRADGTFTGSESSTMAQSIDVSAACLSTGDTCAQFASTSLTAWAPQCSPAPSGGCTCTGSTLSAQHQFGTYSTAGTTLIETVSGGTPVGLGYCVQGTQLTVIGATAMGPTGGDTKYTVLTKQ